jgi:hypothetical protein
MTRSAGWAVVVLVVAAMGCAVNKRPRTSVGAIAASAPALASDYRQTMDSVVDRLARRAVSRGDRTLDVLILSGGGQMGAYGAGFLRGWQARTDAPMPKFDLVTGISTGALQAPFALLGTNAELDTLSTMYLAATRTFAPKIDWFFWLRRTGGVLKTDRYRSTVRTVLASRRDALRAEFQSGRQLIVGTTDYDLGTGHVWDLSRELDTTVVGLERATDIVYGSTAIPGAFPPQLIDGHLHGDGGTVSNLLTGLDLDAYRNLATRLRARGVTDTVTVRVWTIVNLWTHMPPKVITPSSIKQISARGTLLMLAAQQQQTLVRLATLARAMSADVPGLRMEFQYTAIPVDLASDPGARKLFDAGFMRRLDALGAERAGGATPWDAPISSYARPSATSP